MVKLPYKLFALLLLSGCERSARFHEAAAPHPNAAPTAQLQLPALAASDTLQVQGKMLRLFPTTRIAFNQLSISGLPPKPDSTDSPSIAAVRKRIHGQGSKPLFKLDNNRHAVVQDDTTDTDASTTHLYWGELATAHQWVVYVGLWEGSRVLLVDQRTGQKTYIWGKPVTSPNGKYLVAYSYDMAYDPTGLQLYSIENSGPHQLWQHNTSWGPINIRWVNNRAVIIEKQDTPTAEFERENNSWVHLDFALSP